MITMVLMYQVSSCLAGVSHTPFDGLELPSGITKNGRYFLEKEDVTL
jgi:hypothetical protein